MQSSRIVAAIDCITNNKSRSLAVLNHIIMNNISKSKSSESSQSSGSEFQPDEDISESSDCQAKEKVDNENDKENVEKRVRKKRRNPAGWIRNVQKMKRAKGESYTSTSTKKVVPHRKQGIDCKCARKCINKLSAEEKEEILTAFNNLADQEKQDSYLSSLVQVCAISRRRKLDINKRPRNYSYKYKVIYYKM